MKKSAKLSARACASVVVAALVASCGTGTESRGETERTRNVSFGWVATTTPVKAVIYGTQDGLIEYVVVPEASGDLSSRTIYTAPSSALGNTVSMVAFDSARSEVIFGTNTAASGVSTWKMSVEDSVPTELYASRSGFLYGGGYDTSSRVAVFTYVDMGSLTYVVNSIDEPGTTILESKIPFYAIPHYDGSTAYITTGSNIREITVTDPTSMIRSTPSLSTTPFDLWGYVRDPLSDSVYGARRDLGEILSNNLDGSSGIFTQVGKATNPASLAAFSDGTLVAGTGSSLNAAVPTSGALTIIDPTETRSNIELTITSDAAPRSSIGGVQSVWAIESPIATAPPTVSIDESGNLVCSDATWRGDLPLSRLSRAPFESARSYAWFVDGKELTGESSEKLVTDEFGNISCAVVASNAAGVGYSEQSTPISYSALSMTTTTVPAEETTTPLPDARATTTTVETSGGSESTPTETPVMTVPAATPGTPTAVVTPALRSVKWTFTGRTVKVTFRKFTGARKYRLIVRGATRKTITCKTAKTTVTCTTRALKSGINSFSAKALSTSGITLAISSKTRNTK
jgi:hypothetical protein